MTKKVIKNSFKKILFPLFRLVNYLFSDKHDTKVVAFIKTDNIGDYVLFRNILPFVKKSEKYKNKIIILIGNNIWKDLAEYFDKDYIDIFFWIDMTRYKQDKIYRLKILWQLNRLQITELINIVHSRTIQINELCEFSSAKTKITCSGDAVNLGDFLKLKTDALFDKIVPSLSNSAFEFFRNKIFIEQLIGQSIELNKPYFESIKKERKSYQILIFPSAHALERRWDTANFAHLIRLISNQIPELEFLILGGKNDYSLGEKIINNSLDSLKIRNLCGKTSLVGLVQIIADSRLLISNETSAVHIAAAVDTPTICISNGNHFGRFNPYPINMNCPINYFYPNEQFNKEENWGKLIQKYQYKSELNINQIKPEMIFPTIISILIEENK